MVKELQYTCFREGDFQGIFSAQHAPAIMVPISHGIHEVRNCIRHNKEGPADRLLLPT